MRSRSSLDNAIEAVGTGMLAVAIQKLDQRSEQAAHGTGGLLCTCQHCQMGYEQPNEPTQWYSFCPYCGEQVLPNFVGGGDGGD